jgi:uncharacterized membrane protein YbhN (UPF0104 family)
VLLAALLIGVQIGMGWTTLLSPWSSLPKWVLGVAFGLTALSYLARAARVQRYFGAELRGRFLAVVRLSFLHNTANNLLPMRAGELVFPWLMQRYFGHGFLSAGASLLWIRLLDLHFLGLIALLTMWLRHPSLAWVVGAVLWLLALSLAWTAIRWFGVMGSAPGTQQVGRWGRLLRLAVESAPESLLRLVWLYLWTAISWSLKFVAFALILGHFLPRPLWQVVLGVMGAELSSVLPFHGIAGSGSYELAAMAAMAPFGVAPVDALAGAVNLHLFLLASTLLLGAVALLIPIRKALA